MQNPLLGSNIALLLSVFSTLCYAQDQTGDKMVPPPAQFFHKVQARTIGLDQKLTGTSQKYLKHLSLIESRLLQKMHKVDTVSASHPTAADYLQWIASLQDSATKLPVTTHIYVAHLDTLQTTLLFFQDKQIKSEVLNKTKSQILATTKQLQHFQAHLDESSLITQYILQRTQQLTQYLGQFTKPPSDVTKEFNRFKATAFYYRKQLEELKNAINSPQKIEKVAISQLTKNTDYQQFIAQHSLLASLFQLPLGYGSNLSLQGLQTKDQVQKQLQQQVSAVGQNGQNAVNLQMQQAKSQISKMQNNLTKYGVGGQELDMPNFTPNQQKTRTFLKRLTYGASLQLSKSSNYFPVTGNFGLSVGYKINDKCTIGVRVSYNIGLGRDWGHMHFTNQGLGLGNFLDWRIKKTYYVTGGYELNYMSQFSNIAQLKDRNFWQPSALLGVEKKYKISSKLEGNIQILFDALYRQELPGGQMFKVRVGYGF